jgi:polysaccharide export outer membrane protein
MPVRRAEMKVGARNHKTLAIAALIVLMGCASSPPPPFPEEAKGEPEPYKIGIPDQLRVAVWKHPDLSVETVVRRDGKISVPLLNDVQAAGLTPEELTDTIKSQLSAFVSSPDVTVLVVSPDSQVVTVIGAVANSGTIPLLRDMGVLEAVAAAGGFNAWANKGDVRVIRKIDGTRYTYRFNYRKYLKGEPNSDITLKPGDVVLIPE